MNNIEIARDKLNEADSILITAGAGMGVDSDLPDFRGNEGFWNAYPVARRLGLSFVDLANPEWFEQDPKLAWAFYGHRLNLYRNTKPHDGFKMLLNLAKSKRNYFVFTSNVDGQFQMAGFDQDKIYECHGSIHHLQCTKCPYPIFSADNIDVVVDMEEFRAISFPYCPSCGEVARPNILMFGDRGWDSSRSAKQSRRFHTFLETLSSQKQKLIIIEIGAGSHVPTVRHTSEDVARSLNSFVIRINPREEQIDPAIGVGLAMGGLEGITRLLGSSNTAS